jgi:DNA-binding NarL/FixJ family response regulator
METIQNEIKISFSKSNGYLTPREKQILALVASGYNDKTIADDLRIRPSSVKTHISSIYKKTNSNNRFQAVLWAFNYL